MWLKGLSLSVLFSFLTVLALPLPATAGEFHQNFANVLAKTPRDGFVSGIVMIAQQPNAGRMQRQAAALGLSSRWRQHQYVVQNAQQLAARTQENLLRTLDGWKRQGSVRSYESFWITNMVAVEAQPSVFDRLVQRNDVGTIYENAQIQIREGWSDERAEVPGGLRTLPDNLVCVNVQPAWDAGFHGEGRIVASFDTGADGNHPALAERWRGAQPGVEWWEAWKDPYQDTTFPWDSRTHGTHVLGIMVGVKPDSTPIGVAPGAQWIAAGVLIGYNVQKIIECYEWATDPDGDPGTIDDVPDVINNSWGTSIDCDQTYWNAIDIVEAAGIVNTIAVDNTGPGYMSVNSPESRALTSTVNWGVGNVDPHTPGYPIATSSGRGPSPCDSVSIKPEVTAPGTSIYSCLPGGDYGYKTGTSMACPHTSGAVAILRQINPDMTVDEIKTALMVTAVDKGDPGEDNTYGWGIIDIGAAVDYARRTLPMYPPLNLTAEVSNDSVALTWGPPQSINPNDPLSRYRVYRAPLGEAFPTEPIAEVMPLLNPPRYLDVGLLPGSYHYVVTALYRYGESGPSNDVEVVVEVSAAPELSGIAAGSVLNVSPNPFNPVTVIRFRPVGGSPLTLGIYDATGSLVHTLVDSSAPVGGEQSAVWDGTDANGRPVASGAYFVRLEQGASRLSRRITLLK